MTEKKFSLMQQQSGGIERILYDYHTGTTQHGHKTLSRIDENTDS